MNKRSVAVILVTIVVILTFVLFFLQLGEGSEKKSVLQALLSAGQTTSSPETTPSEGGRTVDLTVKNWEFDPPTIIVAAGQTVTLRVKSVDVPHSFMIEQIGTAVDAEPFKTKEVTIKIPAIGRYAITCTKNCGPTGYDQMKGMIVAQ